MTLCNGFNLKIANGRTPGDRLGNMTCYNNKGASVVDYVIADQHLMKDITKLIVYPPAFTSKHCPTSFELKCKK